MRTLAAPARVERLVDDAIARFGLDLGGIAVLTETASGPFVVTPLIAARAGASVVAVTRDSRYGDAARVRAYTEEWAARLDIADAIEVHIGRGVERAGEAAFVTNLGFVRPIDAAFVESLRPGAAVSLMCEPWEVRPEDVDIAACRAAGVPVAGTDERDPRLQTFRFVGMLGLKLLLELEVEVFLSKVVVISSDPFATPIVEALEAAGAEVLLLDVTAGADLQAAPGTGADALVVAEHRDRRAVIGGETGIPVDALDGIAVAHIAGAIDDPQERLRKNPPGSVAQGRMTVTTDALGPRPVVDLHAAGLRVGQALVQGMRELGDASRAEAAARDASPAQGVTA
jgi:voltage-gated potassium channel Kch